MHIAIEIHISTPPSLFPIREDLHLQTLKAFVDLHEFVDLNLVQALR